jgi:thymidylate synthase (FAD)
MSSVKLISTTPNIEENIAYIARVSSKNQENTEITKLLKYCIRKGHWSVFEQGFITIEISTSRAIARQILRHKSFNFSEFSQRYQSVDSDGMVYVHARRQDVKNRQNSIDDLPESDKNWFINQSEFIWNRAMEAYEEAISRGIALECARALLPEGLTPTKLYVSGSVRSWIHFIDVRTEESTQLEHRIVAEQCKEILKIVIPTIFEAKGW